jgi:thiamine biosynthesis lipoprotein
MRALRLAALSCGCLAIGCASPDTPSTIARERLYAMGTWVDVTFQSADDDVTGAAIADIEQMLRQFERDYYPWTPGALANLNTAFATGRAATVDPAVRALLQRAQGLSDASDGYFDPGIGALVELWGFDSSSAETRAPPADADIDATLEAIGDGFAALELDAEQVRSRSGALKVDLGGIAKGAAIERCIEILQRHGIDDALVNAGGDLVAVGRAPGERAWRVGIRHSREDGMIGIVELGSREAAFTSGDYERFFEHEGQRLHHLLDPNTGRPATHTQALTVLANDPVLADAAATALFIAGPERWRGIAENLGISEVLRIDADGTIEMTAAMSARVQLSATNHDIIAGSSRE